VTPPVRPPRDARGLVALAALAGAGALAAWSLWVEPRRVVVRRVTLELPRWPARWDGFRIALVSDLHAGSPHVGLERVERVVDAAQGLRPDLVALLGDYVDDESIGGAEMPAEAVAARLGRLRAPLGSVAVLGNPDWGVDGERVRGALRDAGIRVLENDAVALHEDLWVAGVADPYYRHADVEAALRAVPEGAATLLFSHDPDLFVRVPERVALTLSGHTHGGQVSLPRLRAKWTPSRFGERYAGGHVVEGGRHLFISRGIGTSRLPVRLGAPPEVVLLELRPAARAARAA
jgi:predicted MPP superfamily phosphohydrolase